MTRVAKAGKFLPCERMFICVVEAGRGQVSNNLGEVHEEVWEDIGGKAIYDHFLLRAKTRRPQVDFCTMKMLILIMLNMFL